MKHQVRLKVKEIHKNLVQQIKGKIPSTSYCPSWEFRHRHVAYCLLRGRTIEQIERKVREDNQRDESLVEKYKDEYLQMLEAYKAEVADETLHSCG